MKKMTKVIAAEMGKAAFLEGKARMANPFNYAAQRSHFTAWDEGWVKAWVEVGCEESTKQLA